MWGCQAMPGKIVLDTIRRKLAQSMWYTVMWRTGLADTDTFRSHMPTMKMP